MKKIFILLILVSTLAFAQASFDVNSTSITEKYSKGDFLKGSIEISFDEEPINIFIEDSLGNKKSLTEVLEKNLNYKYNCSSEGCLSIYGASSPASQKTFSLDSNDDKIMGFQFTGVIESLNDIQFKVQSSAGQSAKNQLKIDILNDNSYETGNTKAGTQIGMVEYDGCFDDSKTIVEKATFELNNPYCQRIELPESPAFMLGAWIEATTAGSADISMSLYTEEGTYIDECVLAKTDLKSVGTIAYCRLDYLVPEESDYYVCAQKGQGDGTYKIKAYYDQNEGCGFKGTPKRTETNAYKIVAKPMSFAAFGTLQITNELPEADFTSLMYEYIEDKYGLSSGYLDCSNTCVVPIKFSSFIDQQVTLSDLQISYDKVGISGATLSDFYEVSEVSSKITSESQTLILDGLFQLPSNEGTVDYILKIGGDEIYSEEIEIQDVEIGLNFQKTASGFPNQFNLTGNLSNIVEFQWDFGDNGTTTTTEPSVYYIYKNEGNFTMSVKLTDFDDAEFEKTFNIIVANPKDLLEESLDDFKLSLSMFKSQIQNLDPLARESVEEIVNITSIEANVKFIENALKTASTQEQYDELISIVLSLSVPSGVFQTSSARVPFFVKPELVDLNVVVENSGGYFDLEDEISYKNSVAFWAQEHLHIRISTKNIMIKDVEGIYPIDSVFEIVITPKEYFEYEYYLYLLNWEGMEISNANIISLEGYNAIMLSSQEQTIKISGKDLSVETLPMFISPSISNLQVVDTNIEEFDEKNNKLLIFILVLIVLMFIGFLVYLFLQRWYRVKYEKYLFKDRTNLYNVMIYVNNSKKNGLTNEEIKSSLRKSGWSGEQIRYIMRKYEGRNTGMYEFNPKNKSQINASTTSQDKKNPVKISSGLAQQQEKNRFNPRYKL